VSTAEGRKYPAYAPRAASTWWLRGGPYRRFAAREFTAAFAAAFSVIMLLFLYAISRGPQAYEGFLRWLKLPAVVGISAVILVAVVYHAFTWFRLTAHIQVVRLGRIVLPKGTVLGVLIAAWTVASAVVTYLHVWL
jgi:fumarate reductase subunit C